MANFDLKDYVPVNERIQKFYDAHPNGRITTEAIRIDDVAVFKAYVYREKDDAEPSATGHAYELAGSNYINKTSYIENCETSAVGRALAMLGIEINRSIASRNEMEKVERMNKNGKEEAEIDRLKKIVWQSAKELGMDIEALNNFTQDYFGGDYPVAALNEAQLTTISQELAKKITKAKGASA